MLPLKQVSFTVNVVQGFADMVMHQKYVNELEQPLEIEFMMPIAESFTCHKIALEFQLEDGSVETFETKVIERERAEQQYEDSVASGETAVLATLPPIESQFRKNMIRLRLGNIPPLCTANLRAFCNQKLEVVDQSYCYRLPMAYVPAYMGNSSNWTSSSEDNIVFEDPERHASIQ